MTSFDKMFYSNALFRDEKHCAKRVLVMDYEHQRRCCKILLTTTYTNDLSHVTFIATSLRGLYTITAHLSNYTISCIKRFSNQMQSFVSVILLLSLTQ